MKYNATNVEMLRNQYMERDFANPTDSKKFDDYLFYLGVLAENNNKRFGRNPQWNEILVREKSFYGWLRPYMMAADALINGRWSYWHDILLTQKVENKPIPQIKILNPGDEMYDFTMDMLLDCIDCKGVQTTTPKFNLFVDWLLYSLGSPLVRSLPSEITDEMIEHWYKEFKADIMLMHPADYFAKLATDSISKRFNNNNFYPTPSQIVQAMATMALSGGDPEKTKYKLVSDICLGTGSMLLHASNYSLRLQGTDIDPFIIKLATLNGYFYIPWLVEYDDAIEALLKSLGEE